MNTATTATTAAGRKAMTIKFVGRRAYRMEWAFLNWMPIARARAELLIATGQAVDVTGTPEATI